MKIAINVCFGGFSISRAAVEALRETECPHVSRADNPQLFMMGRDLTGVYDHDGIEARTCPHLIKVIEDMGTKANGYSAELKVIEVPDGTKCHIEEYDGNEHVAEDHQTWS